MVMGAFLWLQRTTNDSAWLLSSSALDAVNYDCPTNPNGDERHCTLTGGGYWMGFALFNRSSFCCCVIVLHVLDRFN